jgi:hypothetical protein
MRLSLFTLGVFCALLSCAHLLDSNAAFAQIMTNNGASVKTCTGSIVQINGSVHNASGTYDNTGTTTITGNCTNDGTIGDSGTINLAGDWINDSSFVRYIGVVIMYGTSPQSFGGTHVTTYHDLTIRGGSVKTCNKNQIVDDTMDFTSGVVNTTDTTFVTFTTIGNWKNGSSTSYVNGPCGKDFNSTNEFTYPIGKHARFNKCGVKPNSTTATTFRTEYFDTAYSNTTSHDSSLKTISKSQYWNIDRTTGTCDAKVRLYWIHGDYYPSAIAKVSDLKVGRWADSLWTSEGNTASVGSYDTGNIVSKVCTTWGRQPHEPFTICSDSSTTTLPVELDHFAAKQEGGHVRLDWLTRSESQNLGFEIERSSGNDVPALIQSWQTDPLIKAKSHYGAEYATLDDPTADGIYIYDLYQRDVDGARWKVASQTLLFRQIPEATQLAVDVYPNPVVDRVQLRIGLQQNAQNVQVELYDVAGRKVLDQSFGEMTVGYRSIGLNGLDQFPSGRYTVVVRTADMRVSRPLIINK